MVKRKLKTLLIAAVAAAFLLTGDPVIFSNGFTGVTEAQAQRLKKVRKKRRTLLEILFGGNRIKRVKKTRRKKRRSRKIRPAAVAAIPVVEKLEDAKVVLVVGDFFAGGLAKGLKRTFSQVPSVKIVSKSRGSSGFVRLDYYNWSESIGPLIDELQPSVVVSMLGTNDRQLMRQDGKKLKKRTEEWDTAYKVRVENFARAVAARQVPLVWMGLPPVRFKKANQDFLFFNETYRSKAEKVGGQFIDVWDGFTDAEGTFVTSGPDVNGQIVRLRSRDGINVTKAGQDKLAFYAEKSVRKLVGNPGNFLAGLAPAPGVSTRVVAPSYDPAKTGRSVVIQLNDPSIDGGNVLAGAKISKAQKVGELIVETADQPMSVAGRADDASWPKKPYVSPKPAAPLPATP